MVRALWTTLNELRGGGAKLRAFVKAIFIVYFINLSSTPFINGFKNIGVLKLFSKKPLQN